MSHFENTLIQVTSYGMGKGDESLALKLISNYFKLLINENQLPSILIFYNEGVKLIAEGSPVLNSLQELEGLGVKLLACKTCIDFYQLTDNVKVGMVGTMIDIIALQGKAKKVISL
jgi:selenium metabolism protein YedF